MSKDKSISIRVTLVYIAFMLCLLLGLTKTFMIQNEGKSSFFRQNTKKLPTRSVKRYPRRGEILDRNRVPLLTSVSFFDVHMDPTVVKQELFDKEVGDLSKGLSFVFPETSARDFENLIRKGRDRGRRYITIKRKATYEQRTRVRELAIFKEGRNKGGLIDTDETILRKRPHGEMLKRTLGYFQNNAGENELRVGLEGAFNEVIAGEPGEEIEQKIPSGWKRTGKMIKNAVEGGDLVTSIDMEIQEVAHSELYRQLRNQSAKSGCVIVMDVKTGFVRAISNLQLASDGEYYELYNHAVGTKEVPGSTFKLATLMAALEDKKIKITDKVKATGKYTFYENTLKDSNPFGYGEITIKQAFELSSNVIARVIRESYRGNPDEFTSRLKSFGLAETLGVVIQGEPAPTLRERGHPKWSGMSLPWMAIGYEVQQTPLQTLAFYNAVANNGKFVRPLFVEEIRRSGKLVKRFQPEVIRKKICSDNTLKIMRECLKGVVQNGTGKPLQSSLFQIAGKTGTAVVLNDQNRYGEEGAKKYQASFVGYFPADEPLYSCIVVVAAPNKDIYGATVSGTVFSAIANKVYSTNLKFHKEINHTSKKHVDVPQAYDGNTEDLIRIFKILKVPFSLNMAADEWSFVKRIGPKTTLSPRKIRKGRVPNVLGMTAKDAVYLMEKEGLVVKLRGYGIVSSQSLTAGSESIHGVAVKLTLK